MDTEDEIEKMVKAYSLKWIPDELHDDHWQKKQKVNHRLDIEEHFENGFKAGYAAATPPPSPEGLPWINADNPPKENGYYICWCGDEQGLIHYHVDTGWQNGFYNDRVTHYIKVTPPSKTQTPVKGEGYVITGGHVVEELKRRFAKECGVNELDTREADTIEWTVAAMSNEAIEEGTFEEYMRNARDEFVIAIKNQERSNYLLTAVDSFLICFDQMRERLTVQSPQSKDVEAKEEEWIDNSISTMQLNIGRLEVNCFDEDAEMSIKVGQSRYQSLSVDEAKELASFIVSHIKNETEANPDTSE